MRSQQQRGQEGRPQTQAQPQERAPSEEEKLKRIFYKGRFKEFEALFQWKDRAAAQHMVNRLAAIACQQFRKLDAQRYERRGEPAAPINLESLVEAVLEAARMGIEPIGDQAYLVPYKGMVQMIPGPGGLINIAKRSGYEVSAEVVLPGDEFDYALGSKRFVHHKKAERGRMPQAPNLTGEFNADRQAKLDYNNEIYRSIRFAYALIENLKEPTAQPKVAVLTFEEIDRIRMSSRAGTGPWFEWPDMMAIVRAIKRGMKQVPRDYMLNEALLEDEDGAYPVGLSKDIITVSTSNQLEEGGRVPTARDMLGDIGDEQDRAAVPAQRDGGASAPINAPPSTQGT